MKQKFKKVALTAAVAATSMGGMVMTTAPAAHAGTDASCVNTVKKGMKTFGGAYATNNNFGVNYSCNVRIKAGSTGKKKFMSYASKGAWVKSAKSGYVRWDLRQLNGKSVCGGYTKANSTYNTSYCNVKKGYTYIYTIGSASKLQPNTIGVFYV